MLRLLREEFPGKPLFILGESMGGAVALAALSQQNHDFYKTVDGVILLAPAFWSRSLMPWYQRYLLWLAAHTAPAKELTGEGLNLVPSDNIEMLKAMSRDPLVIKATRVDVLYGVTNLMDRATSESPDIGLPLLIMYGKHDQIVPRKPTCKWLHSLPAKSQGERKIIIYEHGYHMLNRDLQAAIVLDDIISWLENITGRTDDDQPYPISLNDNKGKYDSFNDFCSAVASHAP
jgi:alpha-beta hydrolase superfamily lysophospholipase